MSRLSSGKSRITLFVLVIIALSFTTANAGLTKTEVSQLFVSLFNRASEGNGNAFFQTPGVPEFENMEKTAAFMLTLQVVKDYFGPSFDNNQAFVELIFKNTLNRLPADGQAVIDGIAFWVGALEQGYSRGFMVSELIKAIYDYGPGGSQHHLADAATLAAYNQFINRVAVSDYLADHQWETLPDYETVTRFGAVGGLNVTDDAATVDDAKFFINTITCSYSISPSSGSFTSSGGTSSISVTASNTSCAWTVSESLDWASLSSTGETDSGTVTVTVSANIGAARTGSINITGKIYTISQEAVSSSSNCGAYIAPGVCITIGSDISSMAMSPLLGVNAGPTPQGDAANPDVTKQYQEIGVTAVRTHDLYGPLDMSVMYPDRTKNPALSSSYNFTSSDKAFDAIIDGGFEPYFRIGDSWNNVTPPTNETERANWAAAATYIVGHYRERGTFKYVEIWNEPDLTSQFWPPPRTRMEFLNLYVRTAKAIKTSYPELKVGGPAFTQASFMTASGKEYLNAFLVYVKSNTAPLDFLSWHCYSNSPSDYSDGATYFRRQLDANGFVSTENIISEFNTSDKDKTAQEIQSLRLGGQGTAIITGSWISLVKGSINQAFLYRGNDTSMNFPTFYGLFYADGTYKRNAHAFSLWSKISAYPYGLNASVTSDALDVADIHLLAGRNSSAKKALLLANMHTNTLSATLNGLKAPIRIRMVNDASTSIQESSQTSMVVTIPGYSTILVTDDGM